MYIHVLSMYTAGPTCLSPAMDKKTESSTSSGRAMTSILDCNCSSKDSILRPQYKHLASLFSNSSLIFSTSFKLFGRV